MKNIVLLLLGISVALLSSREAWAQGRPAREIPAASFILGGDTRPLAGNVQRHARYFTIAPDRAPAALGSAHRLSLTGFPVAPDCAGTLELERTRSVIDSSTEMWAGRSSGSVRMPPVPV